MSPTTDAFDRKLNYSLVTYYLVMAGVLFLTKPLTVTFVCLASGVGAGGVLGLALLLWLDWKARHPRIDMMDAAWDDIKETR